MPTSDVPKCRHFGYLIDVNLTSLRSPIRKNLDANEG